jgi:hypothetical protein
MNKPTINPILAPQTGSNEGVVRFIPVKHNGSAGTPSPCLLVF